MAILSWRISWMTTSRSVMWARSTSGRAPSISSNMRFWISAVSLKRPPTLCTISSLLSASIIVLNASRRFFLPDQIGDLRDRPVDVVVNDHVVKGPAAFGHPNLTLRPSEPFLDRLVTVPPAVAQAREQRRLVRRHDENHQCVRILKPHLQRALHVDLEQHVLPAGQVVERRVLGRAV